jgi:hypothetical protein
VVSAAFSVEPRSEVDDFFLVPTEDVSIRNKVRGEGTVFFDVTKSTPNNEFGAIYAVHRQDPSVALQVTIVDGRVRVWSEGGRELEKSAYQADEALRALTHRLNALTGDSLGAITAGTLHELGYEKAFEVGAIVSNATNFLPGPPNDVEVSRRQQQEARYWSRRRAPVEEIDVPAQRASPPYSTFGRTPHERTPLTLPRRP